MFSCLFEEEVRLRSHKAGTQSLMAEWTFLREKERCTRCSLKIIKLAKVMPGFKENQSPGFLNRLFNDLIERSETGTYLIPTHHVCFYIMTGRAIHVFHICYLYLQDLEYCAKVLALGFKMVGLGSKYAFACKKNIYIFFVLGFKPLYAVVYC